MTARLQGPPRRVPPHPTRGACPLHGPVDRDRAGVCVECLEVGPDEHHAQAQR